MSAVIGEPPEEWGPDGFLSPQGLEWIEEHLIRSKCCGQPVTGSPPRCSGCGHRVNLGSQTGQQHAAPYWAIRWTGFIVFCAAVVIYAYFKFAG